PGRTVGRASALHEEVEDVCEEMPRDPAARVLHRHANAVALARGADVDPAAGFRVTRRIGEQVGDHLREALRVAVHVESGAGNVETEMVVALLEERARHLGGAIDDSGKIDTLAPDLDLAARDARHI